MKKILIIFGVIILIIGLLIAYFFYLINHKGSGSEKEFIVKSGQSTKTIAQNLQQEGIISSSTAFVMYVRFKNDLIQVGVYKLSSSQNIKEILAILASGKASEYLVTIPEGWRVTQIDEYLAEKKVIQAGELLKIASSFEGYLFPDTYRFLPNSKPEDIKKEMMDNFVTKTAGLNPTRDNIILASIVEREAKFDDDRAKIAGVYLNRLDKGMKLEADPTIQYAKGSWNPIKVSDYRNTNSLYNTYQYLGLPPGPICNPGLKSIEAVMYPQKGDWLYFFNKEDGHAVFSATLQEHEDNLKKYR
ncbi:MAG: Aminodeoxychorismate lyase [Berkelbacteria bacterium GW2011_GWB1_38_5]|uniref:Endolytic murein transglycosylase n=1 Tax=Berkelbacteria bacterium GW2011_GWB1_38_5 TaxID=1618336 RepID=A0A0G0MJL5_9BACT|nr:MAG: Aminodeoxychorismate lyase [Berkelbacteria bacterium GW2011_GWB1_38_5]